MLRTWGTCVQGGLPACAAMILMIMMIMIMMVIRTMAAMLTAASVAMMSVMMAVALAVAATVAATSPPAAEPLRTHGEPTALVTMSAAMQRTAATASLVVAAPPHLRLQLQRRSETGAVGVAALERLQGLLLLQVHAMQARRVPAAGSRRGKQQGSMVGHDRLPRYPLRTLAATLRRQRRCHPLRYP